MRPLGRFVLGALTLAPLIYLVFFFITIATSMGGGGIVPFETLFVVHTGVAMLSLGLMVFYVIHALTRKDLPNSERLLWAIILFVGNMIAMPVYFFLKMKPQPADAR